MVWSKGRISWNKGLTKEIDSRVARQGQGINHPVSEHTRNLISLRTREGMNNPKTRKKLSLAASSRPRTPESNLKRSITLKGRSSWKVGLTKETHPGIALHSQKLKEYYTDNAIWNKGLTKDTNEIICEAAKRMAQTKRENWKNLSPDEKSAFIRKWRKATSKTPNKTEQLLDSILQTNFPGEWEYVGDGKLVINGKIPDFANINGRKALIELFGDYWHRGENPQDRIDEFSKLGYYCLIIWESDLVNIPEITKQIANFYKKETQHD